MHQPTSDVADTICRTVELGVTITDAAVDSADRTHIWCRVLDPDQHCPACGIAGRLRDHTERVVTDIPAAGHPVLLRIAVPRFVCETVDCARSIFRADITGIVEPRAVMTSRCARWIVQRIVVDKMSVAAVAANLGIAWKVVNLAALSAARALVYTGAHLDGVRHLGVDEHKWKHVRGHGESSWVTVLIDLTPVVDGTGPARLLDMIAGRSKQVLKTWLDGRDQVFRDRVKVVAMDGFTGYKTATAEELPAARIVMDPFHVVALAGDKLDRCRTRVQQATCGHRGRTGDPLYKIRRILRTRPALLTDKQKITLFEALTSHDEHAVVEVTYQVYLQVIAAYEHPRRREGKKLMFKLLKRIQKGLPDGLEELAQLGRTLWSRRAEILAYFDVGVSNGPVEAVNGRLEHLRGIAQGFRNLDHYIFRSLLHSGQLADRINAL
ncbi:ISL3 family transposase [Gordonia humi]|uniref:Transposase n=2 Tax=Gordonia humi TaxID=686429 RepID=A0A840F928_9ACTN|nr:ISL3 family transposase [Gordonia humi]MBB4138023.1 transposase [Gordonia humi]MBB4138109.1 transposase [Gordonia humi]MBB4138110.1 transposase [Gordonia humi]MBB4138111.1 transposase [Gordonia humi]MBB4138204.1 transposase [Gordonia humi]